MTTIGMTRRDGLAMAPSSRSGSIVRKALLAGGILSSLLYFATDVLGGLRYGGYSFTSQAISELAAIGAPSKSFVDPLFLSYQLLALAFGIGVFLAAAGRRGALRNTALMMTAYGATGFLTFIMAGPAKIAMHQRGIGSLPGDAPHIILTAVLVMFLLLAMTFGAFALGKRFRRFSFATLLIAIVSGALTVPFAARVAAGLPTLGLGIVERIDVYSCLLWIAVLSIALLRRPRSANARTLP